MEEKKIDDIVELENNMDASFYSQENMAELERRVDEVKSGKSTLKEHELIEVEE